MDGKMPVLALQLTQVVSGRRSMLSFMGSALVHFAAATAALVLLEQLELCAGLSFLVPCRPLLAVRVTPTMGMLIEAAAVAAIGALMIFWAPFLESRGLPRILNIVAQAPLMRAAKGFTGPFMQPAIALAIQLRLAGLEGAASAAVPYVAGPLLGGGVLGLVLRGRSLPFQDGTGVPIVLAPVAKKKDD